MPKIPTRRIGAAFRDAARQCFDNALLAQDPKVKLRWALRGIELFEEAEAVKRRRSPMAALPGGLPIDRNRRRRDHRRRPSRV